MPLKSQEFFYIVFKLFESTAHESINFTPYQFLAKFFDCVLYIYLWRNSKIYATLQPEILEPVASANAPVLAVSQAKHNQPKQN